MNDLATIDRLAIGMIQRAPAHEPAMRRLYEDIERVPFAVVLLRDDVEQAQREKFERTVGDRFE